MEKITGKYYLGSSKNTYILYERKISQTTGKETYKNVGYFTNLEILYAALVEKEVKEDLEIMHNIKKITELIQELKDFTKRYIGK